MAAQDGLRITGLSAGRAIGTTSAIGDREYSLPTLM